MEGEGSGEELLDYVDSKQKKPGFNTHLSWTGQISFRENVDEKAEEQKYFHAQQDFDRNLVDVNVTPEEKERNEMIMAISLINGGWLFSGGTVHLNALSRGRGETPVLNTRIIANAFNRSQLLLLKRRLKNFSREFTHFYFAKENYCFITIHQ